MEEYTLDNLTEYTLISDINEMDRIAEVAGGYVEDLCTPDEPHYEMRKLVEYCKNNRKQPYQLSEIELERFLVK